MSKFPKPALFPCTAHLVKHGCLWTWNAKRLEHVGKRTTPIAFLAAVWARAEVFGDFRRKFRAEGRWLVSFILDNKDAQKDQINISNWMTVIPQVCV